MSLTDTQRETLARAYYEPLGWDLDDLDDDEFRECLSAFEPVVAAVEAIVAPYAEALARVEALADPEGLARALYQHSGLREDLIDVVMVPVANAIRAAAALAPATPDTEDTP